MIKCGIIGCGVISGTHTAGYQAIPGVKVTHLCDLLPERTAKLAATLPEEVKCFTDYREMLADTGLDCVSICTDHASHAEILCEAIKAGKHVICEKVLGRTPEDLEAMIKTAGDHPEIVATGIFQHRFNAKNIALKELIRQEKFGKLLTVNLNFACLRTNQYYQNDSWRGTIAGEGGGVMINQAIHFLDQLRFLFGNVKQLAATSANLTHQGIIEVEDTAAFVAEFASGLFVTVNATNSAAAKWRSALTICGTEAQVEIIDEKLAYLDGNDAGNLAEIRKILEEENRDNTIHGKNYYGTGHTAQLADFIAAIREKRTPGVTLKEAANSAALVHAVYASAANRQWCDVKNF